MIQKPVILGRFLLLLRRSHLEKYRAVFRSFRKADRGLKFGRASGTSVPVTDKFFIGISATGR